MGAGSNGDAGAKMDASFWAKGVRIVLWPGGLCRWERNIPREGLLVLARARKGRGCWFMRDVGLTGGTEKTGLRGCRV